jgi:hypothetical protein
MMLLARKGERWSIFNSQKRFNVGLTMVRRIFGLIYCKGLNIPFETQVNGAVISNWQGND